MMITMYSFMMAMLWSSIFILLLSLCRRSTKFIERFGVGALFFLCILSYGRMLLPFEFHFTQEIETPTVYNPINDLMYRQVGETEISIYQILAIIWLMVTVVLLFRFIVSYIRVVHSLKLLSQYQTSQISRIIHQVIPDRHKNAIMIVPAKSGSIPKTIGIYKGYIILPVRSYKDKELKHILAHEYTHFQKHDGLIKLIAELFCILYWWNPLVYLLRAELESILELRCDRAVTKTMKQSDARYYLKTIANSAVQRKSARSIFGLSLSGDNRLKQRFVVLLRYRRKKYSKAIIIMCILFTVLTMTVSYLFVFQPAYYGPDNVYLRQEDIKHTDNTTQTYSVTVGDNEYTVPVDYLNQNN